MGSATNPNWVREPVGRQRQEDVSVVMIDFSICKMDPSGIGEVALQLRAYTAHV